MGRRPAPSSTQWPSKSQPNRGAKCTRELDGPVFPLTHSLIHSFTHSLIHTHTHSHTHSFIHSLIHALTHSLIHSFISSTNLAEPCPPQAHPEDTGRHQAVCRRKGVGGRTPTTGRQVQGSRAGGASPGRAIEVGGRPSPALSGHATRSCLALLGTLRTLRPPGSPATPPPTPLCVPG